MPDPVATPKPGETPPIVRDAHGHEVSLQQSKLAETETPPAPAPKVEAPKPATTTQAAPAPTTPTEPKRARVGVDDAIPEDADLIELPRRALDSRLARHTKAQLKDRFGTSDLDEIKTKLDRLGELEKAEEERKRAAMSEQERVTADLERERQLRVDAERRVQRMQEEKVINKTNSRLGQLAVKHVRSKYSDYALGKLAAHLRNEYTDAELIRLKDSTLDEWFANLGKENPELARKPTEAAAPVPPKKVPLTNGGRPRKPESSPSSGTSQARSFAPSAEAPMSSQEAKAEAAKQGYRW